MIKENAGLEFRKFQEKFYNEPGILNVKELQKISMEAGKDLETKYFRKIWQYNTDIIQDAVESGQPVPAGTYIITKPDMKPYTLHMIKHQSDKYRRDRKTIPL